MSGAPLIHHVTIWPMTHGVVISARPEGNAQAGSRTERCSWDHMRSNTNLQESRSRRNWAPGLGKRDQTARGLS
jgi:hypothetical protein